MTASTLENFRSEAAPRRSIFAWWLYDMGGAAFNAVIISFVFAKYVADGVAANAAHAATVIGSANTAAAVLIALLAPLMGTLADSGNYRRKLLIAFTLGTVACSFLLFFVVADKSQPNYLLLGAALMALGGCLGELGNVFYNAMLPQMSTRESVGRISGIGLASGYVGGVICLVITLFFFVKPIFPALALPTEDGLNFRYIAVLCGFWLLACALPLFFWAPDQKLEGRLTESWSPWQGYRTIARQLSEMWRSDRPSLHFFLASAIVRDSLAAIFALAGVVAFSVYGWTSEQIIIFGLLANVAAGLGAYVGGKFDDKAGPKAVVIWSTTAMIISGLVIFFVNTSATYFVAGLVVSSLVGPSQSAMRTLLTRVTPPGRENSNFGLYATAGRALSFLGHGAFTLFTAIFSSARWGMLGITTVMIIGLLAFIPLRYVHVPHNKVSNR